MNNEDNLQKLYDACMMAELAQDFQDPNPNSPLYLIPTPIVSAPQRIKAPSVKQPRPTGYYVEKIFPNVPIDPSKIEDDEIDICPIYRPAKHDTLLNSVINELKFKGLQPDQNHIEALKEMTRIVMGDQELNRPVILPVIPGYGKTTLLLELIKDRLKNDPTWCALIVLLRAEDIFKLIDQLPQSTDVAIWPTFRTVLACPKNQQYFNRNVCQQCASGQCPVKTDLKKTVRTEPPSFKKQLHCIKGFGPHEYDQSDCNNCNKIKGDRTCPIKHKMSSIYTSKRVIFITHEFYKRMVEYQTSLNNLTNCNYSNGSVIKRQIFIDERPHLVDARKLALDAIARFNSVVSAHLPQYQSEIKEAWIYVMNFFGGTMKAQIPGSNHNFRWTSNFKAGWDSLNRKQLFNDPNLLIKYENMINSGGYYENKSFSGEEQVITLSQYSKTTNKKNRTVIFDGTGLFDQLYRDDRYYIHQILDKKRYTNLTLHIYTHVNLSKEFYKLKDDNFYQKFCDDIIQMTTGKKTLVVCYKKNQQQFAKYLSRPDIYIDYWGNMRGKNDYLDTTHVIFTGIVDYGENVYAAMDLAISGDTDQLKFTDRINKIKLNQMTMELYQQIYRSKLRRHDSKDEIHIYLATRNSELISELKARFRLCNIANDWAPSPIDQVYKLKALVGSSSKVSRNKTVCLYVDTYDEIPPTYALQKVWPGKMPQYYSNLRSLAKNRLAGKTE